MIRTTHPPTECDVEKDIEWFCESLGLLGKRDKHKTGLRIFMILIESSKNKKMVSVNEIAKRAGVTRTTVIHHLKTMKGAGLVVRKNGNYELRMRSLQKIVDEIKLDIERTLNTVREIAEDIDRMLNLPVRPNIDNG